MSIENMFGFIGWYHEPTENSDKIWGFFYRPDAEWEEHKKRWGWAIKGRNSVTFWGRRGKAMQFKASQDDHELQKLVRSETSKGYVKISSDRLMEIWPTFISEAEAKLMWEVLAGTIK